MPTPQEYNDATQRFAAWAAHMLHCSLWADAYDDFASRPVTTSERPYHKRAVRNLPHAGPGENWCADGNTPPRPKRIDVVAKQWVRSISTECFNWVANLPDRDAQHVIEDAVLSALGHGIAFDDHVEAPDGFVWSADRLEDCTYLGVIGPRGGLHCGNAHLTTYRRHNA